MIIGIDISKETTRRSKIYANTQTTSICRPHSCIPTCKCFSNGALTPICTIRSVDCDSWGWQWRTNPVQLMAGFGKKCVSSSPSSQCRSRTTTKVPPGFVSGQHTSNIGKSEVLMEELYHTTHQLPRTFPVWPLLLGQETQNFPLNLLQQNTRHEKWRFGHE